MRYMFVEAYRTKSLCNVQQILHVSHNGGHTGAINCQVYMVERFQEHEQGSDFGWNLAAIEVRDADIDERLAFWCQGNILEAVTFRTTYVVETPAGVHIPFDGPLVQSNTWRIELVI